VYTKNEAQRAQLFFNRYVNRSTSNDLPPAHRQASAKNHRSARLNTEAPLAKNILRTGKKVRPKTAVKGKRFRCAGCHKRSPRPVKSPAPWYCASCLKPA
jgi:hypothetical protein